LEGRKTFFAIPLDQKQQSQKMEKGKKVMASVQLLNLAHKLKMKNKTKERERERAKSSMRRQDEV
jgi:hypothetical protein